jgi:hypothetical protein
MVVFGSCPYTTYVGIDEVISGWDLKNSQPISAGFRDKIDGCECDLYISDRPKRRIYHQRGYGSSPRLLGAI